jgi:hypothetical protein
MSFTFPVESGHALLFARSVGDRDPCYEQQLDASPGTSLVLPPTFTCSAEHFDPESTTRPQLPAERADFGGSADRVHAEQHFEYYEPLRVGEQTSVDSFPGRTWTKEGRSGLLEFTETITEFRTAAGALAVRARKVGVRIVGPQ